MSVREQMLRSVGRYEIVREVGRGGMAVVYLARQTDLDRDVALKELSAFHAGDPNVLERFLRESRLAGSLSHPNIVTVHEHFEHDRVAYIAMEYFERGSLRPQVGRLDVAQVAGVLDGLLAGLAHAERRGIVHRDLKPENVMVTSEGGVKIADFGIAKALEGPAARSLTSTGAAVGTPAYMAPELATGGEVGAWTDLYALGVMAYELFSGTVPFHETEQALALMLRHANEPVPPLGFVRADLDPGLAAWVDRLLAKSPRDRPRGAAEASEELDEILLRVLGPRWRRNARLPDAEVAPALDGDGRTPVAVRTGPTPELEAAERPRRTRLRVVLAVAAVAVAVSALAAWFAVGLDDAEPAAKPVADVIPASSEQLTLAVSGPGVYVADPQGRIAGLDPATLAVRETLPDPARPRSAIFVRGSLLVADGEALTALDPSSFAARGVRRVDGVQLLAAGGGVAAVAIADGTKRGRVCVVAAGLRLTPCAGVAFSPSGLGVASSGSRLYVADRRTGTARAFRRAGGKLVPAGAPIPVGAKPHGRLVPHRGLLYVPVERGVAVVDPAAGRAITTVSLPVTPSDLWVAAEGLLFAALPGIDRVAVIETASPGAVPTLVAAGDKPVAVAGSPDVVYVANAGDDRVTRLDARTGKRLGSGRIAVLGAPPPQRLVLQRLETERAGDDLTITLALGGGRLDDTSLVLRDGTISDGSASFELWQGGIRSLVRGQSAVGLTTRVAPAVGRLGVVLSAPPGAYERLRIAPVDGRTIRVSMRATRITAAPPGGTPTAPTGDQTPPTQPKTPTKQKTPTYDVG